MASDQDRSARGSSSGVDGARGEEGDFCTYKAVATSLSVARLTPVGFRKYKTLVELKPGRFVDVSRV